MSVMLPNTHVSNIHSNQGQYLEILLHLNIDDNYLPDFKCSNKTVRRQYILNQVLKTKTNTLGLVLIITTTTHYNYINFVAIVSSDRSSLRYNTPKPYR